MSIVLDTSNVITVNTPGASPAITPSIAGAGPHEFWVGIMCAEVDPTGGAGSILGLNGTVSAGWTATPQYFPPNQPTFPNWAGAGTKSDTGGTESVTFGVTSSVAAEYSALIANFKSSVGAISIVHQTNYSNPSNVGNDTITIPSTTAGNLLLVAVSEPRGGPFGLLTLADGGDTFTQVNIANIGFTGVALYSATTAGGKTSFTWTAGDSPVMWIFELTDVATTGNIVIAKKTVPSGVSQVFTFTPSYGASFTLTDGQSNNSGPLAPGTYSVGESPEPGWSTTTSSDSSAIVVTAGATTTVTFINTNPNAKNSGGGGGIGSGKNIYFDYNLNQQCWNLPGILQVPASALGSIETSPGVWRLLISSVLSGINTLAYRDITNFTDLGLAYTPNAVFGSIQLADPGNLAKFGGRGGMCLEYESAGIAPTLTVLFNEKGATLSNEIGSQITGNFTGFSSSAPIQSIPTLADQTTTYRTLYYYMTALTKRVSSYLRHMQFQISAPAENAPTELIGFGIFGDQKQESEAPGQLPQLQGK